MAADHPDALTQGKLDSSPFSPGSPAAGRVSPDPKNRTVRELQVVDMFCTCDHVIRMSTMIQIRNVPEGLHRRLKARAALAGMSLSEYLLREVRRVAQQPTLEELRVRLERRPAVTPAPPPAQAVRAERDSR